MRLVGGDRPEHLGLVPQHRQIGDGLTAVSEHHRQIRRDPARIVPTPALPQHPEDLTEPGGQPGHLGHISQEPGAGMTDHTPPVSTHNNLRTRSSNLHSAGAFREGLIKPSTSQILPDRRHPPYLSIMNPWA
ncbi:hypothetical protein GCM10010170_011970 [Dactylosporangium salmoneum]|uniref:Uncharacterized protein n=1 Tax=Dactylosporangium salmoneum TaxID=53361 RepID=A0ABP5SMS7_9ACTN